MRPELFIGGQWRMGRGARFDSVDPATEEVVWSGAAASAEDVADAMAAAQAAFPTWARRPRAERIAIARKYAEIIKTKTDEIVAALTAETGKTLWDCRGEAQTIVGKVELSIRALEERTGEHTESAPFGRLELEHRPHGVLAVFGPFNFPGHLPNGHIVPALLAGNTIVFKPSELTPSVAAVMAEAWAEAGLPPGVLNVVQGGRDTGAALLASEGLRGVLFTGSAQTGAYIHKLFAGRPDVILALELGGNNPLIVWPPADVNAAANLIVHSAFVSSGQRCSCARRLILPSDRFGDVVIEALKALIPQIEVGPSSATPEPFMGPLVRAHAAEHAMKFEEELIAHGGRQIVPLKRDGALVWPGLIDMTNGEAEDEELFGPLLQIYRVATFDEALERANATRFGLAGGLISDDPQLWERARIEMRAGVLNWNRPTTGASGAMPFGGPGLSGSLRPSAYYAADYCAYPVATQAAEKAQAIPAAGLPQ
ncbi:MAG: succinylglutamate-semialdehyde dehydrogenase [Hyphomonadaceae bacterium]